MEKEFVPYQEALALKELGFDEGCFGHYISVESKYLKPDCLYYHKECTINTVDEYGNKVVLAPTWQSAFRWFRKEYGIFVSIVPNKYGSLDSFVGWIYVPLKGTTNDINVGDYNKGFTTPEEAELHCLQKLIEIVESK